VADRLRDARAVVRDLDDGEARVLGEHARAHLHDRMRDAGDRVERVREQVDQDLLERVRRDHQRRDVRGDLRAQRGARLAQPEIEQRRHAHQDRADLRAPIRIVRGGEPCEDVMKLILTNVRSSDERRADFEAQIGSLKTGEMRLLEIVERRGKKETRDYAQHLISYSARMMRRAIASIPDGTYEAEDALDDDGISDREIPIRVRLTIKGERAIVDFTGSSPEVAGALNAVEAITVSAVSYCFRCLVGGDVPASAGLIEPIDVIAPEGTVVNARPPASVAGGNVETSQRIVDTVFKALAKAIPDRIPAASQGTMNNLTIGGIDPRTGREFSYYETVAGGMGARPAADGMNATHTHMTNSLNTPAEALEYAYPLRVRAYRIRPQSGGRGKRKGGDGAIREIETLAHARMAMLSDRRRRAPYGLQGGADGEKGRAFIIRRDGSREQLSSKGSWDMEPGDRVRIETPSGGGWGRS